MACENKDGKQTITCDKCGRSQSFSEERAGRLFFNLGWVANFRAKKYVHLCYGCQPKKMQKTTDWARQNL